jgi:hypothetical protein
MPAIAAHGEAGYILFGTTDAPLPLDGGTYAAVTIDKHSAITPGSLKNAPQCKPEWTVILHQQGLVV